MGLCYFQLHLESHEKLFTGAHNMSKQTKLNANSGTLASAVA